MINRIIMTMIIQVPVLFGVRIVYGFLHSTVNLPLFVEEASVKVLILRFAAFKRDVVVSI
jgi:hypothetical protein